MFLQTIYYPLALFANNTKGKALELLVKSPVYRSRTHDDVPHLDASAAIDNGTLVINVDQSRQHRDQPVETDIELEGGQFSTAVEVSEVNAPDVKVLRTASRFPRSSAPRGVPPKPTRTLYDTASRRTPTRC